MEEEDNQDENEEDTNDGDENVDDISCCDDDYGEEGFDEDKAVSLQCEPPWVHFQGESEPRSLMRRRRPPCRFYRNTRHFCAFPETLVYCSKVVLFPFSCTLSRSSLCSQGALP